MINNIFQTLLKGKNQLKEAGIDSYIVDATVLLMAAADISKIELLTGGDRILENSHIEKYFDYIVERKKAMPIQYILNNCEFMSLPFYVDENVLIPRPDTEILTEYIIKQINDRNFKDILEIGTGSGCISISVAHFCRNVNITASDISQKAIDIAIKNARTNKVLDRINFIKSDLFESLENLRDSVDIIISNPPYIKNSVINTLSDCVRKYEPYIALSGGEDGLFFYKSIAKAAKTYLRRSGIIMFEIGFDQSFQVSQILVENKFNNIKIIKDLAGLDRVVIGYKEED